MLKFTELTRTLLRVGMGHAAKASLALAIGLGANAAMAEKSSPYFTYDYVLTGPIESRRDEYVALRDARDAATDPAERQRLASLLAAIPIEQKWTEHHTNLVTDVGANDLLTQYFKGSAYTAAWYMGLVDNASFTGYANGNTMASHSGWIEAAGYTSSTRPAITFGTSGSRANVATAVSFAINTAATINGAFVVNNSVKSGTTGTLYSCGAFTGGNRTVASGDTLNVTLTVSA